TDHSIRAVVLTSAGKAFSAGGDIPEFIRIYEDQDYRRLSLRRARRIMDAMTEFPKPVVAAVNGPAVGLGASIAISCDLVLLAAISLVAPFALSAEAESFATDDIKRTIDNFKNT